MEKLIIFDLDGTIVVEPEFYQKVYSGTLNQVVRKERGRMGLKVLQYYRKNFNGKGEFSLFALNIPFRKWAKQLIDAPLDLINPQPALVEQVRKLEMKKVIYTGSPIEMALSMLKKIGFLERDFDFVLGWREPELFPLKWSCSPLVSEYFLKMFSVNPKKVWSVGDSWETDLKPAQVIGIKTAEIRNHKGNPTCYFNRIEDFLAYLKVKK